MIKLFDPRTPWAISLLPSLPAKSATILLLFFKAAIISPFFTNLFSIFRFPTTSSFLILYVLESLKNGIKPTALLGEISSLSVDVFVLVNEAHELLYFVVEG